MLLLFLNSLLADLPQTALAAVVIVAALSLMDLGILRRYLRVRRSAFGGVPRRDRRRDAARRAAGHRRRRRAWRSCCSSAATGGRTEPSWARSRAIEGWHDVDTHPDAEQIPGVVVYRWEAPLFFANAGSFRQQIRQLVRERQPEWVVLQCEAVTDVDVTAAEMLEQLDNELNAAGIHLAFAEMRSRLQDLTLRYGLMETLDRDHFYPTLEAALEEIRSGDRALDRLRRS